MRRWVLLATMVWAALVGPAARGDEGGEAFHFGVLQHSREHLDANRRAGADIVVIDLAWDRAEPKAGEFSDAYLGEIRRQIATCRKLGYGIALDLGFQYPPAWAFDLPGGRYINQFGEAFASKAVGEEVPNAVFSQAVRDAQEAYLKRVFERLGKDFAFVRLGWMKYGELAYPAAKAGGRTNCYWAYDDLAQGKADGRPAGVPTCPVPGWRPGEASPGHAKAKAFLDWYLSALRDYHDWQIHTTRKYTPAPLAMLYPSWGMRPASAGKAIAADLDGSTPAERTGEVQRGLDFRGLVAGIRDPRVYVYCTWLDSSPSFGRDDEADRERWSPAHYLAVLAAEHRPALQAWGENTGGGDAATVALCFERIRAYGYRGLLWAFERDLYDGTAPEMRDVAEGVREVRAHTTK